MKNGGAVQILRVLVQILHNPKFFRLLDNLGKKLLYCKVLDSAVLQSWRRLSFVDHSDGSLIVQVERSRLGLGEA
jgi:hypothetical protein